MNRRFFLTVAVSVFAGVAPVWAGSFQDKYVDQLKKQGFVDLQISRTWLGRTRITASSKTHQRELIFNGRSGEILRDYLEEKSGGARAIQLLDPEDGGTSPDDGDTGTSGGGDSGDSGGDGGGTSGGGGTGGGGGGGGRSGVGFDYVTGGHGEDIDFGFLR